MSDKRSSQGIRILLFPLLAIMATGIYVLSASRSTADISLVPAPAGRADTLWYYYDETGGKIPVESLPAVIPSAADTASLYCEYRSGTSRYLCFFTHHQTARLLLDGAVLYSYGLEGAPRWLKSYRSFYHIVELPPSGGAEICLELSACIPRRRGEFNSVYLGTRSGIIHRLVRSRLDKLLLGVVLFTCGMFFLFLATIYNPNRGADMTLIHLAFVVMTVGLWQAEESRLLQLVVGSQAAHWLLEYVLQFFILFSSILFVQDLTPPSMRRYTTILLACDTAVPLLQIALQVAGAVPLVESVSLLWPLFAATCLYIAYLVFRDARFRHSRLRILFCLGMAVSGLLVITLELGIANKNITDGCVSLSFIFLFISLSMLVYKMSLEKFNIIRQSTVYKELALVDFNTGVSSHTAWFSFIEHFDPQTDGAGDCCLILFDMNNLKKLNDTYGHLFGDKVINSFCSCVRVAFGEKGTIFRVGGDEFICLCRNSSEAEVAGMLSAFDALAAARTTDGYRFTAAYGYVFFSPQKPEDFTEAQQRADSLMYEMKRLMKAGR